MTKRQIKIMLLIILGVLADAWIWVVIWWRYNLSTVAWIQDAQMVHAVIISITFMVLFIAIGTWNIKNYSTQEKPK